jgi:hypothetical protein
MANDQKDEVSGPAPSPETNQPVPTRRHSLFGALKGHIQVMPGTDLTKPADPAWEALLPGPGHEPRFSAR